jgi:restriction endonuclease S subunit
LGFSDNLPYEKVGKNEPVCIADEVPFDIPESWEWVTLKQIAVTALGKTLDKSKNIGEYRPYLCSINVYWTGIDLSTVKQARFEDSELSKYQLNKGDLLICEGGDVGRSAVWDRDEEMYYQNALHRVRFYGNIEPRFFQLLMESYKGAKILDNYSKGMTIKHLVQNSLNSIYFPLPPLAEQRRIVEKIKQLTPYLKKYGSVETTLSNLNLAFPDDLKKSILQYAVQGKLVPQDPADEPASVLLEHIRAEKEQLIKAGKIKRDKHESVIFRRDNSYYEKVDGIERCIDDELPFEIPENWEWVRFFSIVEIATNLVSPERYFDYMHNGHEQVSRFAAGKVSRKMVLNFRLFRPTIGRIHQDNVYLIVLGIVQNISEKCVIMEHLRHIHIMQQHISDAKNIRKLFLFNSVNGIITQVLVSCCLNFLTQNFQPAGKKATCATGKIGHLFTDLRVDHLRHKISNSAWRIEFASRTGTL